METRRQAETTLHTEGDEGVETRGVWGTKEGSKEQALGHRMSRVHTRDSYQGKKAVPPLIASSRPWILSLHHEEGNALCCEQSRSWPPPSQKRACNRSLSLAWVLASRLSLHKWLLQVLCHRWTEAGELGRTQCRALVLGLCLLRIHSSQAHTVLPPFYLFTLFLATAPPPASVPSARSQRTSGSPGETSQHLKTEHFGNPERHPFGVPARG